MTARPTAGETVAERRLRALADDARLGIGDFQAIDSAHGEACDMGREALALLRERPDEHDLPTPEWFDRVHALLARARGDA